MQNLPKPYRLLDAFTLGLGLFVKNYRAIISMASFPLAILVTLNILMDVLAPDLSPFYQGILTLPAQILMGVVMALMLRWFVLGEHPTSFKSQEASPKRRTRNISVRDAALGHAAVLFTLQGLLIQSFLYTKRIADLPTGGADPGQALTAFILLIALIAIIRYLWVIVPLALYWDVLAFFKSLGGFPATLRILMLLLLTSLVASLPFDMLRLLLLAPFGPAALDQPGGPMIVNTLLVSLASVLQMLLFTCVTAAATALMMGKVKSA